ncbi:GTPase IMAP family member 2 [Pimephales promelas]|uniref:GTPase IMAP family member 2 n=1 Tax=Pimephales promelas TaxID=90988 RepID=UPI001955DC97|nr:GTPase IMAP family member 2 [Pimephales promelas]
MADKSPQGGSSVESELRIVILGNAGDCKNKVVKSVLNCENLTGVKVGQCTLYQRDQDGRRISVVEAPGWDRSSKQQTPENIKEEVKRSVSLFPPGPHALLLVIPVETLSNEPSTNEITAAQTQMKLLSECVWKHTIVLFACDEGMEDSQIKEHIRSTKKILDKCGGRHYVLQKSAQNHHELIKKIDDLVEENGGDFFTPQAELIKLETQEASGEKELRKRRGSIADPPDLNKDKGDAGVEKKGTTEADKPLENTSKISMESTQFVVILMGVFGALIGAVAGAENGVSGSVTGLFFGIIVAFLLASIIMYIYTRIYLRSLKKPADSRVHSG